MKKYILLIVCAFSALLLCACGATEPEDRVLVSVVEEGSFTVDDNGQWIVPGGSASFLLHLPAGSTVVRANYAGEYTVSRDGSAYRLDLADVRYPTRVEVEVTSRYRSITYDPNGGTGEVRTVTYDIRTRSRPNTAAGSGWFTRDGYSLIGWQTADGEHIGLGSRVTVPGPEMTLFAEWAPWTDAACFDCEGEVSLTITGYHGSDDRLVLPELIGGKPVTAVAAGAFRNVSAAELILPGSLRTIEDGAFLSCSFDRITLFDNIQYISDAGFTGCTGLRTLNINAAEAPYGYQYRRESVYADKVDMLINAQGQPKLVFYGGCSMWYNLDGAEVVQRFGDRYAVINLGLNGTVNSYVQMQILGHYLEQGDVFFHTPEISSSRQLLTNLDMSEADETLWCGLEYNYDLFSLVDLRNVHGVFDSLRSYLDVKMGGGSYDGTYTDSEGRTYMDPVGSIPFIRTMQTQKLADRVYLNPAYLENGLDALAAMYKAYEEKGVRILVSYACVNMDAVPEEQRQNAAEMDALLNRLITSMDGPELISSLEDYLFCDDDFYDTNYHMLSAAAERNTALWLRDLEAALYEN